MVVYICAAAVCASCPVYHHHGRSRQVSMVKPRGDNERRIQEGSDELILVFFHRGVYHMPRRSATKPRWLLS